MVDKIIIVRHIAMYRYRFFLLPLPQARRNAKLKSTLLHLHTADMSL